MSEITDYTALSEPELVDRFSRMDPRYAPEECARLAAYLTEHDFIVSPGQLGPGIADPSPAKMQALIGSPHPVEFAVDFGGEATSPGPSGPTENDFGFFGPGTVTVDGVSLRLVGTGHPKRANLIDLGRMEVRLPYSCLSDVETQGNLLRVAYRNAEPEDGALVVRLADTEAANRLATLLPKARSRNFTSQLVADAQFAPRLIAQAPNTPVTWGLLALNVIAFDRIVASGSSFWNPGGSVEIEWGSNYGPYTSDGEWWRLLTSQFIHFGFAHLLANMVALVFLGRFVERLYGSVNFLMIYLLAGVVGGMASIFWHPGVNAAGASGAIFGLFGALLAQQVRPDTRLPPDVWNSIAKWAVGFALVNVSVALNHKGIDYVAHLGGLAAGFLLGVAAARAVTGSGSCTRRDLRRLGYALLVAVPLCAIGFWGVRSAAQSLTGEALYWHTFHWLKAREPDVNADFNRALALAKSNKLGNAALADRVDQGEVMFWQEASDRLDAIDLPPGSRLAYSLGYLEGSASGRLTSFQFISNGLRGNNPELVEFGERQLRELDQLAQSPRPAGGAK